MLQPGTILLEKYRVERVLGKGGMGVVLAVRHIQLGELFAIKILLPESREQPEALERFLLEARASAKLKSDHVARVHDIGKLADGTPYMLMEYLEGEDLGQFLARRGKLSVEEAALYVHQACEAIAKAHANGIVHRDLKPSNLFLTHQGNGLPCVKVLDFGIVKELDPTNKVGKNLTKTGTFLGSPIYMSPEQMVDIKMTDTRGDVWALGVILYEFVTGQAPFASEAVTTVVTKVLLSHPEPPSHLNAAVSVEFDGIVMRCLEKQPDLRYRTARELRAALEPFLPLAERRGSAAWESSGPISHSLVAQRLQTAETMADGSAPQAEALTQTLANSDFIPPVAMAETIPGDPLDHLLSNPLPRPPTNIVPHVHETLNAYEHLANKRDVAQPVPDRKKSWFLVALAACVLLAMVVVVSTISTKANVPISESSSAPTGEGRPAPAEPVPSEMTKTNSGELSTHPKDSASSVPMVDTTTTDVQTSAPKTSATGAVFPTKPSSSTSPSRRVTTKKVRVPGYDD